MVFLVILKFYKCLYKVTLVTFEGDNIIEESMNSYILKEVDNVSLMYNKSDVNILKFM